MNTARAIIQQPPKPSFQTIDNPTMLTIQPELATEIGLNESIVLRQIAFWIKTSNNCRDGQWWTFQSLSEMRDKAFKFWSVSTISRIINKLVEMGLIEKTDRYNQRRNDRTQWFTLCVEKLQELTSIKVILQDAKPNITKLVKVLQDDKTLLQSATPILQNETGILQNETTLPETTTEITTEKNTEKTTTTPGTPGPEKIIQELDTALGRCCRLYESEIGLLTSGIKDKISDALNDFSEDWICDAIFEAVSNNVRKWKYVIAILDNWKREGRANAPKTNSAAKDSAKEIDYTGGKYAEYINTPSPHLSDETFLLLYKNRNNHLLSAEDKVRLAALLAAAEAQVITPDEPDSAPQANQLAS